MCPCVHVAYLFLCSCCVRVLVFMLRTCACVALTNYGKELPRIRIRNSSGIKVS